MYGQYGVYDSLGQLEEIGEESSKLEKGTRTLEISIAYIPQQFDASSDSSDLETVMNLLIGQIELSSAIFSKTFSLLLGFLVAAEYLL